MLSTLDHMSAAIPASTLNPVTSYQIFLLKGCRLVMSQAENGLDWRFSKRISGNSAFKTIPAALQGCKTWIKMFLTIDLRVLFEEDIFCFINSALNFSFF